MSVPPYRPFRPRRARTIQEAVAVGRAWADHEATDPGTLKGHPNEGNEFFLVFDEAADLVDASTMSERRELVVAVAEGAMTRWRELADGLSIGWIAGDE